MNTTCCKPAWLAPWSRAIAFACRNVCIALCCFGPCAFLVPPALAAEVATAPGKLEYNRDIRPILTDTCFACHGVDGAARKADLRLDQRQAAIDMSAIVPGKPDQSSLIDRIFTTDPDKIMPPPKTHKVLTDEQKAILKRWIEDGAEYQPHWSLIPAKDEAPPVVKGADWVRNPIDNFILAKLEEAGLKPRPKRT